MPFTALSVNSTNPSLRLMVGCGLYDLVTTMSSAEYVVSHSGIPLDRTVFHNCPTGHLSYLGEVSRKQLAGDLREFIQQRAGEAQLISAQVLLFA